MEHLLIRVLPLTPLLYHSERLTECLDFLLLSHFLWQHLELYHQNGLATSTTFY